MATAAVIPLLVLGALPEAAVGLLLIAAWVLGGVVGTQAALGGFATTTWLLLMAVFAIGSAVAATGLVYRVALWVAARVGGSFFRQVFFLGLTGLISGAGLPNATARMGLVAPALTELSISLGYAPRTRAAAGIGMAALAGFGLMVSPFLTSSSTALLVLAVLPETARAGVDWVTWAVRAAPLNLVLFFGLVATIYWWYRPSPPAHLVNRGWDPGNSPMALQRALLGEVTRQERTALWVVAALLVGFVSQPAHGLDAVWVALAALGALAVLGLFTADVFRTVNWSFLILFSALAATPAVFESTGAGRWLGEMANSGLHDLAAAPLLFLAALALACFGVSALLRWQAAAPLMTLALSPVAGQAGIDPWLVGLTALVACNCFFFPQQSTIYMALYEGTGGRLFDHTQARPLAVAYVLLTLLALVVSVPVWRLMGLL